ncbi:MAG: protein-glutamate O-methyltransferase CheR [Gammaproteobacteria bacterium]|nr:protein-glutamate O-methyltransferase CheR [Gammaproteobacteria bacterium]
MAISKIKQLLQESMGLYVGSVGDSSIERAIRHRMGILETRRASRYLLRLQQNQDELDELVEEVVVPETWFFRNRAPFEALVKCIPKLQRNGQRGTQPLRILSVPCSTGEEPYSIAMTLLEHGLKETDFHIDAVDISRRALTKARRAIYGKHSFRENATAIISQCDFRDKYFRRSRSGLHLAPQVRERVTFTRANLLKDIVGPSASFYDVVFCRNILIYFESETQKKVMKKLHLMLKPSGILFVGHAEASKIGESDFEKLDQPKSFAFRKLAIPLSTGNDSLLPVDKLQLVFDQLVAITKRDLEVSKKTRPKKTPQKPKKISVSAIDVDWHGVERLISQSRYFEAVKLCEQRLQKEPESSAGYYYLGLISSLQGNAGAAETLVKKSVYLDPGNHRALGLAAVLADQRGDKNAAETLRQRKIRVKTRGK